MCGEQQVDNQCSLQCSCLCGVTQNLTVSVKACCFFIARLCGGLLHHQCAVELHWIPGFLHQARQTSIAWMLNCVYGCFRDAFSADHVTILSNEALIADVIRIAAGKGRDLDDDISSDIDRIAAQIPLDAT